MSETNSTIVSIRSNDQHGLKQEEQSVLTSASALLSASLSMSLSMSTSAIMSAPLTAMSIPANVMSLSMPAMCSFCPGGNADPELVQPKDKSGHLFHGAGLRMPLWRRAFVETNPNGKMVILAEALCCPPAVTITDVKICSFCPAGLTNPDLVLPTPDTPVPTQCALMADNSKCKFKKASRLSPRRFDLFSCLPKVYNFIISLDQDCNVDTIKDNAGIGETFCFLGTTPSTGRHLASSISLAVEPIGRELTDVKIQTFCQLATTAAKIISIQFFELDTLSVLIVINQDGTYSNISLAVGATVTFNSISTDLDPTLPISDQPDLIPGGHKRLLWQRLQTMLPGD
jgi:hypothetical protein